MRLFLEVLRPIILTLTLWADNSRSAAPY